MQLPVGAAAAAWLTAMPAVLSAAATVLSMLHWEGSETTRS